MQRPGRRTLLACATVLMVACSLTSLDGYSGGGGAQGSDGGGSGTDGSANEADVEVSDASTTDGADSDAAPGPFCASLDPKPLLCSDFDGVVLPSPWDDIEQANGATVAIDTSASVSAPGSLLTVIPPADSGTSKACLKRKIVGPLTSIRAEFDIRVEAFGTDPYDFITLDSGDGEIGLQVTRQGVVEVDEDLAGPASDGGGKKTTPTNGRLDDTWKHVSWTMSIGSTLSSTFTIDGVTVPYEGERDTLEDTFDIRLGDCANGERNTTWRVRFDNVVFDVN